MTLFLRVLEQADKATALREAVQQGSNSFKVDPVSFAQVPGSPFAYWVSDRIRRLFKELPPFESEGRTVKQGLATADDFRFVRAWWEIPESGFRVKWFPFAKGGAYSPFYADIHLVVNWEDGGKEDKAYIIQRYPYLNGDAGYVAKNTDFYFRPGLTWPLRGKWFSAQAVPSGCIFSVAGKMAFPEQVDLPFFLALFNSSVFDGLMKIHAGSAGGVQFEVGLVQQTPIPSIHIDEASNLARCSKELLRERLAVESAKELSNVFLAPLLVKQPCITEVHKNTTLDRGAIYSEIDETCFGIYDISGEDRRLIEDWSGRRNERELVVSGRQQVVDSDQWTVDSGQEGEQDQDVAAEEVSSTDDLGALLSWCVGVAFGRFDIRLATGERQPPPDPEPFDPIPKRSPGMVPEGDPVFRVNNGIYVDDPGHPDDLAACVRSVLERVSQPVPDNLRQWLARDFFPLHIRMYSKSRRKAPIYWQLATPSGSYSIWLYIHAFTADTLFRVQNDYIAPKLEHELRRLESMRHDLPATPKASDRKALASQETLVQELKDLLAEVKLVAPLWDPDLDDGVVINSAPLWRLFPNNKAWQREVKSVWDTLCTGKYDWSHLAMRLWPERVVPKCATDRSLAIAHDLEDVFWAEGSDGKWVKRATPTRPIDKLVEERSSAAVGSALSQLLNAPGAGAQGSRGRKRLNGNGTA